MRLISCSHFSSFSNWRGRLSRDGDGINVHYCICGLRRWRGSFGIILAVLASFTQANSANSPPAFRAALAILALAQQSSDDYYRLAALELHIYSRMYTERQEAEAGTIRENPLFKREEDGVSKGSNPNRGEEKQANEAYLLQSCIIHCHGANGPQLLTLTMK